MKKLLLFMTFLPSLILALTFEIVIPTRNNEKMCLDNLKSAVYQNYDDFHVTVINDNSTDKTGEILNEFIKENNLQHKVTLITNAQRVGALANFYNCIHTLNDEVVVINLDGDDLLIHENVLTRVAQEYLKNDAWVTYGQFIFMPANQKGFCSKYPEQVIKNRSFRQYPWIASHLRTFKAGLFKKIPQQDLMIDGNYFPTALELAFMFPMLEMASRGHISFIPEPLYYYITHEDPEFSAKRCLELDNMIRRKPKYKPLKHL